MSQQQGLPVETERNDFVLVVEDDAATRNAIADVVKRAWSLRALPAADFATGLALARHHRPTRAVIDLWLGGGRTGIELIAAIRAEMKDARLVLITGRGTIELAMAAVRAGADDVVCKPFTHERLTGSVVYGQSLPIDLDDAPRPQTVAQLTWDQIDRVHRETGNMSETARLLGIDRSTVKEWLDKPRPPR